jgi:shikimate dehydrogenase
MDVYGLIGNPVGHSLSPPMHEAAYEALGIDARYVLFEPEKDSLATAIEGADALGLCGLNVTIPFKEDVRSFVQADQIASRIGAVNTIDFGDGRTTGHNTDAAGVRRAFESAGVDVDGADAVVVGAGGAGRAAAFALEEAGATVHVANRTADRARDLADALEGASGGGLDTLDDAVPDADVLVNATSVGMEGDETPVPAELLHPDLAVLDAVYTPLETRLLVDAVAAGCTTIDGGHMLVFQAAEAFERWTGRDAPVERMRQALEAAL